MTPPPDGAPDHMTDDKRVPPRRSTRERRLLQHFDDYKREQFVLSISLNLMPHSTPLIAKLKIIKLHDIILLYTACFMYQYSNCNLRSAFDSFFIAINTRHNYSTRLALKSTFAFPKIRTNFGKFNIRYFGPKIWNEIEEQLKTLSFRCFKRELKERFLAKYTTNNN